MRSQDFRNVYEQGGRYSGPFFAAFYLRRPQSDGPKLGFTVPRALGKAVVRNRIKRRLREAARLNLGQLNPQWRIVFNPRRRALHSPFEELQREVTKLFLRCSEQ